MQAMSTVARAPRLSSVLLQFVVWVVLGETAHARPAPSLCSADEAVVFSCEFKGRSGARIAALCASPAQAGEPPRVQYRFGTPRRIEFRFPSTPQPLGELFWLSTTMYSGGGEARIRFRNADTDYILFDATTRTGFGGGPNNPQFTAGIATRVDGKLTSVLKCSTSTPLAYGLLPGLKTEDFEHDLMP
ncbi:MAG TPA: hypothetical protein VFK82_08820 [Burkholderiaceae bacterium]|nr:hypothetical protein [Burkholderiaceae bacterium]